jgi:serine/threonine protein kinase
MNETPAPRDKPAADGSIITTDFQANSAAFAPRSNDERRVGSPVRVGSVLRNRYVIEERLGSGGKGTVFKALDRYRGDLAEDDRYVAIKILHPNADERGDLLAEFRREFYCAQILSHESIVNVFEIDRDGDLDFFTMELLEGELLSSVMARLRPLPLARPQAWAIIREVGSALAHAHARNVVHADLKPNNIMITHSGDVRILDFGASSNSVGRYANDILHRRNAFSSGPPSYACCEILAGRAPDPRDDVYALACLSYELLAGTHPFQRRPATEARDLGIVPNRPQGLTRQQWQTVAMGLSWHRAGRSISVPAWLNKMNAERAATRRVPGVRDLRPTPVNHSPAASLRATTLFAALLITVSVWVSFVRLASGSRATGTEAVPEAVVGRQPAEVTDATITDAMIKDPATAGSGAANAAPYATPPQAPESQQRLLNNRGHDANRPKQPTASAARPVLVSASNYTVRSGEHFAEIRVHRSSVVQRDTKFVWWTEAASAKPGIDYVHQGKVIQSFPKGRNSTSFFVKLVPKASRARREVFYVAIAEAGHDASADPVARAMVWLPMNQDQSQTAADHDLRADPRFSTAALGSPLAK